MIALLDTHGLAWWLTDDRRLTLRVRSLIGDPTSRILVSAASAWEVAIKAARGRIFLPIEPGRLLDVVLAERMEPVAIEFEHGIAAAELPPIHTDPFDRLLIAQARLLRVPILTADPQIARYDVETIW